MAMELVGAGFEIEGCVLFLATWNFASFRYAVTDFDIDGLKHLVCDELGDEFAALGTRTIQNIDLDEHGSRIERVFNRLASMKEVLFTGATKLMHLKCPTTFVIWDDYIRGGKPKKLYGRLPCVALRKWRFKQYEKTGRGYVSFLRDIQTRFCHLHFPDGPKTLAKAIDEFNYVNITLPIQRMEADHKAKKNNEHRRKKDALRRLSRKRTADELERLASQ
ncbi:MAG TPA: hypothetical protein VL171_00785 [Verrucomicrobiae bacterium]|nr:hypothetical protein [Verrucomicrobiae bacterium]